MNESTMEGIFKGFNFEGLDHIIAGIDFCNKPDGYGESHIRFVNKEVFGTLKEETSKERIENALDIQFSMLFDILPEEFQEGFESLYIAGGSIYSLYNKQEPKDYDFFGRDMVYLMQLRGYFGQFVEYSSQNIQRGEWQGYKIVLTPNALSIGKWQVITNWVGTPEEVTAQFDFKHTMNWHDHELHLPYGTEYLESDMLVYNTERARDFVGTLLRVPSFVSKGFFIRKSEMAKILQKLNEAGFSEKDIQTMETLLDY